MTERWRRVLRRLEDASPTQGLLDRARMGPTSSVPDRRGTSRLLAGIVALAFFAASGVLVWSALGPGSGLRDAGPSGDEEVTYPSPPASGYYILLPDRAETIRGEGFRARVTALTNLPDGTLLDISTTDEGTCCPPVKDSKITFETQDTACYGYVGTAPSGTSFEATLTAKPDFEPWMIPGGMTEDAQKAPEQPPDVLAALGQGFANLTGDQVQEQPDGSKWLVATGTVMWPRPRCGGDPIPMFGGPTCDPGEFENQLQGYDLAGVMVDVMGAIGQGRMCEFWSVMLPPDVEAEHPWPEFADEWRSWLLQQDFSDVEPGGDRTTGALRWEQTGARGNTARVDVIHDGERIATLDLTALPDFCPSCGPNVVPFWGVTGWHLRMAPSAPATGPTGSSAPADVLTIREDDDDSFTVRYPIEWFVPADPINDWVCSPYEILVLATYPLRPGGEAVTDFQLPSRAVEDLGSNDILIWLNENGSACGRTRDSAGPSGFPDRPTHFGPVRVCGDFDLLCPSDGRNLVPGIRSWWIAFSDAGRSFYVFVGMGEEAYANPERQQQAWDVLDSLQFLPK